MKQILTILLIGFLAQTENPYVELEKKLDDVYSYAARHEIPMQIRYLDSTGGIVEYVIQER